MKRIISLILALLMITSSVVMMVSCGGDGTKEDETKKQTSDVADDESGKKMHKVPKKDFEGETFNSLCFKANTATYYYFTDEEAAGDPIKEALWQRTELIEEHLNCELTADMRESIESERISMMLYDQVIAGTDDWQQALSHVITEYPPSLTTVSPTTSPSSRTLTSRLNGGILTTWRTSVLTPCTHTAEVIS